MFGLGCFKKRVAWSWAVYGKHPVAGDYIKINVSESAIKPVMIWVDKGYSHMAEAKLASYIHCRFWMKTVNKRILCGVITHSCDKVGRKYPLLIAGYGRLDKEVQNWDLLPFFCETVWQQMIHTISNHHRNIRDLRKSIKGLYHPIKNWENHRERKESFSHTPVFPENTQKQFDFIKKMNSIEALSRKKQFSVVMDTSTEETYLIHASKLLSLLKKRPGKSPESVFFSDGDGKKSMYVLRRSVSIKDFSQLCQGIPFN